MKIEKRKIEIAHRYTENIIVAGEYGNIKEAVEANKANLRGANLVEADLRGANFIDAGLDQRGYFFHAFKNQYGVLTVKAGCRTFIGLKAAFAYPYAKNLNDPILTEECLDKIRMIEAVAIRRGWKLEPDIDITEED